MGRMFSGLRTFGLGRSVHGGGGPFTTNAREPENIDLKGEKKRRIFRCLNNWRRLGSWCWSKMRGPL